ncbi:protein of unknown function [Methylacidimicrobium sp. AP8]|nr:protein of unknown function [Methylacidimicrobium sp. AP8]
MLARPNGPCRQNEKVLTFCYNHLRHYTAEVRLVDYLLDNLGKHFQTSHNTLYLLNFFASSGWR